MNDEREEKLKDLFEKFLDSEQAEQAVNDIEEGERILHRNPAPEPSDELIAGIKAEIAGQLLHRKENTFRKAIYKTMAVAATFILFAVISVKFFEKDTSEPERMASQSTMPTAVWESECLADDSADAAALVAEVEQIESDLLAAQLGENGSNGYETVTELEMELIEINSDFWKG